MVNEKSRSTSNHRPDDPPPDADIPEAPNVPDEGIPYLNDDPDESGQDKPSSRDAQEEQDRQLESGEENPG